MTAKAFADGVATLLTSDATFASAVNALLGQTVSKVLRSNTPFAELGRVGAEHLPCWVVEQGDGVAAPIANDEEAFGTIGNHEQGFQSDVLIALVWKQQDREAAANVRAELPTLVARLFMRNPQPGGIVGAWLGSWEPDRGAPHPLHHWAASINGLYSVSRA